jgi:hypothetical protein
MRRNSPILPKHLIVLAMLLALALTLVFSGVASAATMSATQRALPIPCLSATPLTQIVAVGQPAKVAVTVNCYYTQTQPASFLYLTAIWGDGTASKYPICVEVCHAPPFVVTTSHVYTTVGRYYPAFCLAPAPTSTVPYCTRAEIQVISLVG